MSINQLGKLQLIKSEDDKYVKYETDISMIVSDAEDIYFVFDFSFEEEKGKASVKIDGSGQSMNGMVAYGLQVIDLGKKGFLLNFSLCDEEKEEGSLYICAACFETMLPQVGFIKQLLYYFNL